MIDGPWCYKRAKVGPVNAVIEIKLVSYYDCGFVRLTTESFRFILKINSQMPLGLFFLKKYLTFFTNINKYLIVCEFI